MRIILIVLVIAFVSYVESTDLRIDPLVRIDQGLVRGRKATDGLYSYFLGIPYAQVDLKQPFGAAEPPPNFEEDIFNAYDDSVVCPQMVMPPKERKFVRFKETADCLRLNIYVPYEASYLNPLPVLVWIHGGEFSMGYGALNKPIGLVQQGIIVVTINYRLGPYGFMCLDTYLMPGNQGLKDQYEALRWVKNNIDAFGGNSSDITIGGHSAGSCSAILHLFSPQEKLFSKVIAQSGTPLSKGMFVEADFDAAIKLARHLKFNATDTESALEFLAEQTPDKVTDAAVDLDLILRPCKEAIYSGIDFFVGDYPSSLSNRDKIKDTSIMIGHTSREEEGLIFYGANYYKTDPFYDRLKENFEWNDNQLAEAANIVKQFYIGDTSISKDLVTELADFESDFFMNYPVQRTITKLVNEKANSIYQYVFSYNDDESLTAAGHGAEIPYLFEGHNRSSTEENILLTSRMTFLWSNFVKYGNPTPDVTDVLPVIWEPATDTTRPHLDINTKLYFKGRIFQDRMAFWDLFYTMFEKNHKMTRESCVMHSWPNWRKMTDFNKENINK